MSSLTVGAAPPPAARRGWTLVKEHKSQPRCLRDRTPVRPRCLARSYVPSCDRARQTLIPPDADIVGIGQPMPPSPARWRAIKDPARW
jgi:hypothetical protein